ncbi:DUF4974 domain-containing protein [Sphingobacterium phlebotomi]|uniref:DUF4974 domain-containing protein n=1 Tax=Sphingobacterium phlebotomi TaxID=2605433 RepID=A0A5D4HA74_9SPHI|nr:FecR family protein [Sphingobacterium phlebotomi]TYR37548.1 DUF4974 domain-containing protein [Sphingobacterium phlebotomi]
MDQKRLTELINKVQEGRANEEEILALEDFYGQFEQRPGYMKHLDTPQKIAYEELMYDRIHSEIQHVQKVKHLKRRKEKIIKFTVAASILFLLGVALYIYRVPRPAIKQLDTVVSLPMETESDKDRPVLTLANGQKISLDDAEIGVLSSDGDVIIRKTDDGLISYETKKNNPNHVEYNLMEIPRGQTYQIILPDGTKVWLNAVSSLRYPSAFTGKNRPVQLIGEGYFEVAENKQQPFVVKTASQTIEVLGTHFNVSSYSDEKLTKTTLFEGRVKVLHQDKSVILKPGQQAATMPQRAAINIIPVDLENVLAWRKGVILFENADIQSIMRHLSRKYDIDVEYRGEIPNQKFGGAFQQSASLKELLGYLESYGDVRFEIQGRRVIVMK